MQTFTIFRVVLVLLPLCFTLTKYHLWVSVRTSRSVCSTLIWRCLLLWCKFNKSLMWKTHLVHTPPPLSVSPPGLGLVPFLHSSPQQMDDSRYISCLYYLTWVNKAENSQVLAALHGRLHTPPFLCFSSLLHTDTGGGGGGGGGGLLQLQGPPLQIRVKGADMVC